MTLCCLLLFSKWGKKAAQERTRRKSHKVDMGDLLALDIKSSVSCTMIIILLCQQNYCLLLSLLLLFVIVIVILLKLLVM